MSSLTSPLRRRRLLAIVAILTILFANLVNGVWPARAVSPDIVISQVYGGGGNTGAPYTNDFVELFNRGTTTVSLTGWSVQYTSATGTGNFGSATNLITPLSGALAPGQYLLVQEAAGSTPSAPLPTPDVTDSTPINMSATGGKVALVNTPTPLGCNGGSTPCSPAALATIVDLIGYDGANFFEGAGPAPAGSNTTAALRVGQGCIDTDNNATDFIAGAPNPRNSTTAAISCDTTNPTGVGAANPSTVAAGDSTLLTVAVTPGANPTSSGLAVTANLSAIGGSASQQLFDDGTNGDVTAGDNTFSFQATVAAGTTPGPKSLPISITDAQSRTGSTSISLTVQPPSVAIHDIQGASHISPKNGQLVSTSGIVTAKRSNGFYMQDPNPDSDDATSEGIFVFTSSAPTVNVGDAVQVSGTVSEFRAGGSGSTNLTNTEISSPSISVTSHGNPLPAPVIIGTGGRIPPMTMIEDDATGDVETSGVFDPANDGIDFYESLEGMLVQVNDAVSVGPWHDFGSNREIPVIGDDGATAGVRTTRGGIVIQSSDFNPERIILNDLIAGGPTLPSANVSDSFPGATVGVMDYSFGNFKLEVTTLPALTSGGLAQEATTPAGTNQLAVATFNVENLDPTDPPSKFSTLASLIVNNLRSPDIVAVEEIQDNNGAANDSVVDASATYNTLIAAIQSVGGPTYEFRQINPVDDQDGGEPGGNIRQGFLFRTDRGLSFIDRPGGGSTTATTVVGSGSGTQLSFSPGRIDPTNSAFNSSRKPLAGEFMFNGHHLFAIANHFNSKGGDQPLFGHFQPPTRSSEVQRHQQAQIVHDFVDAIAAADPNADVVVLGDLNDFQFSDTLTILKGSLLHTLMDTLPLNEQYSYDFDGNSQAIDHILLSNDLFTTRPFDYDVVHVNSEFAAQASDHEPQVVRITLNDAPTVKINLPLVVNEGGSLNVTATGSDPNGDSLTYDWDLDNNGSFETPGQSATFSATALDGPTSRPIAVRVTDSGGLTATDEATVDVLNVAPTATINGAPASSPEGTPINLTASVSDPGAADTFTYAWSVTRDGNPFAAGNSASFSFTPPDDGVYVVMLVVTDDDGGSGSDTKTIAVTNVAPVAINDSYSTNEDTPLSLSTPGVLANDTDAGGDSLTAVLVSGPSASQGTLILNANGSFTFTPAANFNGTATFTYRANDGTANSNVATVSITVNSVNDPPVAVNDSATAPKNTSITIDALANDSDVDGDSLTVVSFTQGAHGTVKYSVKNHNFRYTPASGFKGTDTFTYTISDGHGGTATATVMVTIQ